MLIVSFHVQEMIFVATTRTNYPAYARAISTSASKYAANIAPRYPFARAFAPRNSFQANTPHKHATIGDACPIAYEIATPTSDAATKLNTVPQPQIAPPSNPSA